MKFREFLIKEGPFDSLPGGGPPSSSPGGDMGGLGGGLGGGMSMPSSSPPPMGGGMSGGLGGMGGMGGDPSAGAGGQEPEFELKPNDVWDVLKKILKGQPIEDDKKNLKDSGNNNPSSLQSGQQPQQQGMAPTGQTII